MRKNTHTAQKTASRSINYSYRLRVTGTWIVIQGIFLTFLSAIATAFNDTGNPIVASIAPLAFFYFIITVPIGVAVVHSAREPLHAKFRWIATIITLLPIIVTALALVFSPLSFALFPSVAVSFIGCLWLISFPTSRQRAKPSKKPQDYDRPL